MKLIPGEVFTNANALRILGSLGPEATKALNLRRYLPPQGYLSPNLVEACYALHVIDAMQRMEDDLVVTGSRANLFSVACWQAYHGWPFFAVTEELTEAMFLTDPPDDIKWSELQWPLPAATFLLPDTEQVRRELSTSHPLAITVGKLKRPPAGNKVVLDKLLSRVRMPDHSFERDMVCVYYWDDLAQSPMFHDVTAKPEWTLGESMSKDVYRTATDEVQWGDVDFDRMSKCVRLAVNFLCFMASTYQPTALTTNGNGDQPLRKAQTKHNRERDALFGVRWLGQGYRLKRPPQGGHHASPRGHWRRGHWRSQAHGPGRTLRTPKWLHPMWIGGEEGEDQ